MSHARVNSSGFETLERRQLLASFPVVTAADSGAGALQPPLDANLSAGVDAVPLAIPGSGGHVIQPSGPPRSVRPPQGWVAQHNGPGSYWDEVTDLALGDGSVYVTGFAYLPDSNRAFATVKYDYSGRQVWARNYALGGTNGSAQANAVAVDADGNVFVTGWSYQYDPGPPFERIINDAATLKYDADGNLLWARRFRLPGINNQPQDVVIDSAGNAYVAGAAWVGDATAGGFDLMLLKYSPDGVLLWDRTIGRAGDRWDAGFAVALDPDENPVVAGYTEPFFGPYSPIYGYLVKYSASGELQWQREHESASNGQGWVRVAVNQAGQIYAFGEIAPPGDLSHVWTSQYDADGALLWDRHYDGTASLSNYAAGMALTPNGGVVVSGTSWDINAQGGLTQIVTIRYEPDGTPLWQRLDRGGYAHAVGRDVAVDRLGRAYVTGYGFNENGMEDMVTLSLTPTGTVAWRQIYADPHGRSDRSHAIAVDASSNVFVAGDAWVGFDHYYDFTTIRYTASALTFPSEVDAGGGQARSASLLERLRIDDELETPIDDLS
jgi:uncharacterized delta-60 repeat protein